MSGTSSNRIPRAATKIFCERSDLNHGQLMIVYQHHERDRRQRLSGRRAGVDIHPWAKLVSIVDVFDAMTGKRPYRKSITAAEALQFIERNAGTHFDPEMAKCWISAMKKA